MSIMIENQLINKNTIHYHDEIELNETNIHTYYKEVYILVKKNKDMIPIDFYNLNVDEDIYKKVLANLIIYKVSISIILKNTKFLDNILLISNTDIEQFNIFNYTLGIKNIVLPILNINFSDLTLYLNQYTISDSIDNIYKLKLMNNYLDSDKVSSLEYISNMIDNIEESKYWTLTKNCSLSIDHKFKERKIFFNLYRLKNKQVAEELSSLFKNKIKNNLEDYIKDLDTKHKYIDLSVVSNYKIEDKPDISQEHFNQLFTSLTGDQQLLLFTNLMISKKYVHLVINNKYVLNMMLHKMKPMTLLFKYLLSYSWIMLYQEECIKKNNTKTDDTFIFEINTASLLPVFPFIHSKPTENPYMPILVSENGLFSGSNINGIPDNNTIIGTDYINCGICNFDEFVTRMNIFCTNNPNHNLFQDFNFIKYKVAISGSIMAACLQRNHPLMNIFTIKSDVSKYVEYFNEFYSDADVDVMFLAKDNQTFITNVKIFYNQICKNMLKINSLYIDTQLILNKLGYLFVSDKFIQENITKDKLKIKWIKKNINSDEVLEIFKPYYQKLKEEKYNELIKEVNEEEIKEYPEIYNSDDIEFKIYINNRSYKDIDLVYTYKYKITSQYLKHPFELFKINSDDFFSHVSQFHLPCVRAYYNGVNVHLTPSCISAHMTYMNIDYKYVSGSTDILEIINKYRLRGFGTWINQNELGMMFKYCSTIPKWREIFKKPDINDINIFGCIPITSNIFRKNIDKTIYKLPCITNEFNQHLTYIDILKIRNKNIITHPIYDNLKVINKDGSINPIKKWIINFTLDLFN